MNKALEKKKPNFKKIKAESSKESNDDNNVVDIEEEVMDIINKEIDFGDSKHTSKTDKIEEKEKVSSNKNPAKEEVEDEDTKIIVSGVSKADWNREVEKISSKLKMDYNNNSTYNTGEWRSHIEQVKANDVNLAKSIPQSRSVLENLSEEIEKTLDKINKKETMISKNFSNIISDYKGRQKETNSQIDEYNYLRAKTDKMQRDLEELEEKSIDLNVFFYLI